MPGDVPLDELRRALHEAADLVADYVGGVGERPVLPLVEPGEISAALPDEAPEQAEAMEAILADYRRWIEPNAGHWNHPGFLGYFAISASAPGIVGETLAAGLNVNAMLWRSAPAPTELETTVCDWLRRLVGLPDHFRGHINDTASISTFLALAAARHASDLDVRRLGLAGRAEVPPLTVYASDQAHSSVDKAVMALGLGHENLRRIPVGRDFALDPEALARAIEKDRSEGRRPIAVVATVGTTATTAVDPLPEVAALCAEHELWLHVDAAYAGSAAICPEFRPHFEAWERADSIVFNPHKWLFTPLDCSLLYVRDETLLKAAFSLVPAYLETGDTAETNLMDLGLQLGRRFRALKLWMVVRRFGAEGLRERIREHCRLARRFAERLEADPDFELAAPVPFSLVCFRWAPRGVAPERRDALNQQLLERLNAGAPTFLSHAVLDGRFTLRMAVGNLRTEERHLDELWSRMRRVVTELVVGLRSD